LTPKIGGILKEQTEKESIKMSNRKTYDKSFKEEAVKLAKETNISRAAASLGLHDNTLRNWVMNTKERADNPFIDSGRKYFSTQEAEKAALMKENRELKRANEILKETLGFFAASQKK
jgi:transposase